jgi:mannosyltransferase OCH1-like enzyme
MSKEKIEIPKRLFFIWFGNQCPNHVFFCIENFKRKNPDFEIVFLRKNVKQIDDIWLNDAIYDKYDLTIKKCQQEIISEHGIYAEYIKNQKYNLYKKDIRFIQILSDIVRVELINEYGGIYLDCDTYPLKPFDDKLLSYESFCVWRHYLEYVNSDNYFMGSVSRKYT